MSKILVLYLKLILETENLTHACCVVQRGAFFAAETSLYAVIVCLVQVKLRFLQLLLSMMQTTHRLSSIFSLRVMRVTCIYVEDQLSAEVVLVASKSKSYFEAKCTSIQKN